VLQGEKKQEEVKKVAGNTGQQISKSLFICDEYVINFFVCINEFKKGT